MHIEVKIADYNDLRDARSISLLLNEYAQDPMGGGKPLPKEVLDNLVRVLSCYPTAFSVLAYVDARPAGLINCFESLSTFRCLPLVNIHDVAVSAQFRRLGIARKMLEQVENEARARHCCKLTLEVLEGNRTACAVYKKYGFHAYELEPAAGRAMFWQKELRAATQR